MKTYKEQKENARNIIIDTQNEIIDKSISLSWGGLSDLRNYYYKIGKRYGLIKELKENGLI